MNLICFANNTGGGLVCDLLNQKESEFIGYRIQNSEHSAFKVGDTASIQLSVDVNEWNQRVKKYQGIDRWFGTHTHPSVIPDKHLFKNIIAITTMSRQSKLYRWLRYYHGWFINNTLHWKETDQLTEIDKVRELAKNVFVEFTPVDNCVNVEFDTIVSGEFVKAYNLNEEYFFKWKQANPWMYNLNKSWAEKRFDEAEWELLNNQSYIYE